MATTQECTAAVHSLAERLRLLDPDVRRRYLVERSVSCRVTDLDVVFTGQLGDDGLTGIGTDTVERAQVRLSMSSDDLVALSEGRLAVPVAWATGRLRVQASPMDLLKLRQLL